MRCELFIIITHRLCSPASFPGAQLAAMSDPTRPLLTCVLSLGLPPQRPHAGQLKWQKVTFLQFRMLEVKAKVSAELVPSEGWEGEPAPSFSLSFRGVTGSV